MQLRHTILTAAVALATASAPGVAAAAGHGKPTDPGKPADPPAVMHVLRGVVTTVTTAQGASRPTAVAVTVEHGNFWKALGCTSSTPCNETFTIAASTKVLLHDHAAIAAKDRVVVKIRAPRNETAAALAAAPFSVFQLIDQGPAKPTP